MNISISWNTNWVWNAKLMTEYFYVEEMSSLNLICYKCFPWNTFTENEGQSFWSSQSKQFVREESTDERPEDYGLTQGNSPRQKLNKKWGDVSRVLGPIRKFLEKSRI